jgi:hypothetical protein
MKRDFNTPVLTPIPDTRYQQNVIFIINKKLSKQEKKLVVQTVKAIGNILSACLKSSQ